MNRDKHLFIWTLIYFVILGCFLQGCSEGNDKSPVSALINNINPDNYSSEADSDNLTPPNTHSANLKNTFYQDDIIEVAKPEHTITFRINSVYTGRALENATFKLNNENIGLTNSNGEISINHIPEGKATIEITKEGYSPINSSISFNSIDNGKTFLVSMVEANHNGLGSITGKYNKNGNCNQPTNLYVRLYKINSENANQGYDIDRNFIITTQTSNASSLEGVFKITNIIPGSYLIYLSDNPSIPNIEKLEENIYEFNNDSNNNNEKIEISEVCKVEANKTWFWTN